MIDTSAVVKRENISTRISCQTKNFSFHYEYYVYPKLRIYYCNIPKCASTALMKFISHKNTIQKNPRYFTVVREPLSRFKSSLNYLDMFFSDYVKNNYSGGVKDQMAHRLLHLMPQSFFIKYFPYTIKEFFHMGNVDKIFNEEVIRKNANEYSDKFNIDFDNTLKNYKNWFEDVYQKDIELYNKVK